MSLILQSIGVIIVWSMIRYLPIKDVLLSVLGVFLIIIAQHID